MDSKSEGESAGQGTHHTPPMRVPHLKAKVAILYLMSSSVHNDAALGRLFVSDEEPKGLSGKSIQHWIYGDEKRPAGDVPSGRMKRLVEIYRERLPGNRSDEETRALLLSPFPQDLLEAFQPLAPARDWVTLMLDTPAADVKLVEVKPPGSLGITSRRRALDTLEAQTSCPIWQLFRLEILEPSDGWLTVLQWGREGVYGVEIDDGAVSLHPMRAKTLLPLRPPYFREDAPGVRRYLFLRSRTPYASGEPILTSRGRQLPLTSSMISSCS
jgi:hypothetical protein